MKRMKDSAGIVFLFIFIILLGPAIILWSVNTLAEQAQWGWQIPHNIWTYLACWGLLLNFKNRAATR
jgi:hypothetical protein